MLRALFYPILPYRSFVFPILVLSSIVVPCWLVVRLYRHRASGQPLSVGHEILLLIAVVYLAGLAAVTLTPNRSSRMLASGTGGIELRPSLASLTCSSANLPSGSRARGFCVRNARGNVLLFFPLGILLPLIWRRLRFWRGMQIAIALSFCIELLQYLSSAWGSYRAADRDLRGHAPHRRRGIRNLDRRAHGVGSHHRRQRAAVEPRGDDRATARDAADVNDFLLNVLGAGLGLALMFLLRWRPRTRAVSHV